MTKENEDLKKTFQSICFKENTILLLEEILLRKEIKKNERLLETGISWVVCSLNDEPTEKIKKIEKIIPLIKNGFDKIDYFFSTLLLAKEQYEVFDVLLKNENFYKSTKDFLEDQNSIIKILENKRLTINYKKLLDYLDLNNLLPQINLNKVPEEYRKMLSLYSMKTKIKKF